MAREIRNIDAIQIVFSALGKHVDESGVFRMTKLRTYGLLPIIALFFLIGCGTEGKKPSNPNIVATYVQGEITTESLENYLKQQTEGIKVQVGDSLVPVIDKIPRTVEIYSGIIREMVLNDMVKRKIKEKQLDNRNNIRHALTHAEDQVTLQELHSEIHERNKIPVSESEIQQYYDKNQNQFDNKPLYDVREQIKGILVSEKEPAYVEKYISGLKDTATITKNYEILKIPEPGIEDVRNTYEKNREQYRVPQKWIVEQIEMEGAKAKENAEKTWTRVGAGESFEAVAKTFGKDARLTTIEHKSGSRGDNFEKAVALLNPGEISRPIEEKGKYFLARLKEKIPASYMPIEQVRDEISQALLKEREAKLYEERKAQTLFTLHGRRYSLEDFYQEFKEMPPSEQTRYSAYEERSKFVDRMIVRLLLLEDSYDRMLNAKKKNEIEEAREHVLKEVLHEEQVDQKLEVKDEEAKKFYDGNRKLFQTPPKVKVSIIAVHRGQNEAEDKRANQKIEEAYQKLKPGFFKKGIAFEEAAKQYSEDPRTAQQGGEISDWISETANPLVEIQDHQLHEKLMGLEPGEITNPFPAGEDYLIVKVREKEKPRQQSFEEVKADAKEVVRANKHDDLTVKLYKEMMAEAKLVIHEGALKSMINKTSKEKEAGAAK
jgi:parvulin-like peptidyl-prolyl isomerase